MSRVSRFLDGLAAWLDFDTTPANLERNVDPIPGAVPPELARLNERRPDISDDEEAAAAAVAERMVAGFQQERDEWEAEMFGPDGRLS